MPWNDVLYQNLHERSERDQRIGRLSMALLLTNTHKTMKAAEIHGQSRDRQYNGNIFSVDARNERLRYQYHTKREKRKERKKKKKYSIMIKNRQYCYLYCTSCSESYNYYILLSLSATCMTTITIEYQVISCMASINSGSKKFEYTTKGQQSIQNARK